MKRLMTLLAALYTFALLLLLTAPVFAQGDDKTPAAQDPNAVPLLLLLLGIFAILGVGLTYMQPAARQSQGNSANLHNEDEDDQ
jgi:hypothetical protein